MLTRQMLRDYYRLTKPGIIYGNLLSLLGGFLLASKGWPQPLLLLSAVAGTSLVIASACVINNVLDRRIDRLMQRTKKRALATGRISIRAALMYGSVIGLAGFAALWLGTNKLTFAIGVIAWVDYVVLYGIAKRHSVYGTLVGAISGSAPLVAGYTAVTGQFDKAAFTLFVIMFAWQMAHFYAIALYRQKDYAEADIPVLPVLHGAKAAKSHILVYVVLFAFSCSMLTVFGYTGLSFMIITLLASAVWVWRGVRPERSRVDAEWGHHMFGTSLYVLLIMCATVSLGHLLP